MRVTDVCGKKDFFVCRRVAPFAHTPTTQDKYAMTSLRRSVVLASVALLVAPADAFAPASLRAFGAAKAQLPVVRPCTSKYYS